MIENDDGGGSNKIITNHNQDANNEEKGQMIAKLVIMSRTCHKPNMRAPAMVSSDSPPLHRLGWTSFNWHFFWNGTIFIIYPFPCINHCQCHSPFDIKYILHSVLVSIRKASTQTWQKHLVPPWKRSLSPVMEKHPLLFDSNKTLIQPRARCCSFAAFYLWGWGDE